MNSIFEKYFNLSLCNFSGSILITRLKEPHFDKICSHLDGSTVSGIPRWKYILESYYKDTPHVGRQKALELDMAYRGGGNPALNFLDVLATRAPELTLEEFRKVAGYTYIRRNDIANSDMLKDSGTPSGLLKDLDDLNRTSLASLLNSRRGIPDWKYFADEFDFPANLKDEISLAVKSEGLRSPSKRMLKDVFTGMTIDKLKDLCEERDFNLIRNELIAIEKELASKSSNSKK